MNTETAPEADMPEGAASGLNAGLDAGLGLTHTFTGLRFGWRGK